MVDFTLAWALLALLFVGGFFFNRQVEAQRRAQIRSWVAGLKLPDKAQLIGLADRPRDFASVAKEFQITVGAIAADDTGQLFELQSLRSGPFGYVFRCRFVVVENGTAGPDGTCERFMLWVPRDTETAREGVAWTYGLAPEQYAVAMRT